MKRSGYTLLPNRDDHHCFGCGPKNPSGLQMQFYTDGKAVVSWVTVPQHLCGWKNLAHGGILFTILDEIMARAIIYGLKCIILTKAITVEFKKPVPMGMEIRAEGRVLRTVSKREAQAEGILIDEAGDICARATGTFATIDPETARKRGIADDAMFRWFEEYIASKQP
ncbi:MAG TPA: PaaI family thioesterase [Syntrophales bacterium]|nr:PaaI family thioesterase [Syntrophales bacterium]